MWPFEGKKVASSLGAIAGEPGSVDVLTSVVSTNVVTSPVSGMQSALLQIELLERIETQQRPLEAFGGDAEGLDYFASLGVALFGDVLVLRDAAGDEISIIASRARFEPTTPFNGGVPIARVPAELVPFLRRASGRGVVCYRELALLQGDKVRLTAVVEPSQSVIAAGYRSGTQLRYLARDDLGPVVLTEVIEAPGW